MHYDAPHNKRGRVIFDLVLVAIALLFLISGLSMAWRPYGFPFAFALILLVMGCVQTLVDLAPKHPWLRFMQGGDVAIGSLPSATDAAPSPRGESIRQASIWKVLAALVMCSILFRLVSVYVAVPALVLALVWWIRHGSLVRALVLALVANTFTWVVFDLFLQRDL